MLRAKYYRHHPYTTHAHIQIHGAAYKTALELLLFQSVVVFMLVGELLLHVTHFRTEFYDANRNVYGVDAFAARCINKGARTKMHTKKR